MSESNTIATGREDEPPAAAQPSKNNRIATVQAFAERVRPILARQLDDAAEMAGIMKEMRDDGLCGAALKKWLKAEIAQERTGSDRALKNLLNETEEAAFYGTALGHIAAGAAATKDFVVNKSAASPAEGGAGKVAADRLSPSLPEEMPDLPPGPRRHPSKGSPAGDASQRLRQ